MTTPDRGPDLPPADQAIDIDAFAYRWPTGAEKVELADGHPYFYGCFDGRDVEIARRAYHGRSVTIDPWADGLSAGNLVVHPAGETRCPVVSHQDG